MKRRLFWKILLGFWFTFVIMSQGIWLMFNVMRPAGEPSDYARGIANMSVAAASTAIRLGGDQELRSQLATWPGEQRGRLRARTGEGRADPRTPLAQANATAPDGKFYRISYYAEPSARFFGLFNIPRQVVIIYTLGGLLFSAILAWYLTKPVDSIRAGFGRLAKGDFSTRLGPAMGRRRDEIADLAHDFDSMAVRLEELVAARDRLLADVSHELRTPLARLSLAIALARQDPAKLAASLDRIGHEVAKLDEMVGELLTLAKLESGQSRGEDYFNLAEVVKAVIQDARYEAGAKNVEVLFATQPADESLEWIVRGSGKLVSRAVENIIRNALRYSPDGGKVHVALRLEAGLFHLTIKDEGPGVPDEALGALFRPFGISADGFGFGLGLAIAQRAIAVHGGSIHAQNQRSKGLEMTVILPAAAVGQV